MYKISLVFKKGGEELGARITTNSRYRRPEDERRLKWQYWMENEAFVQREVVSCVCAATVLFL